MCSVCDSLFCDVPNVIHGGAIESICADLDSCSELIAGILSCFTVDWTNLLNTATNAFPEYHFSKT